MKTANIVSALGVWLLAIVGAVGVAFWLNLSPRDAFALMGVVAIVAFFGAFLPVARLHQNRKS